MCLWQSKNAKSAMLYCLLTPTAHTRRTPGIETLSRLWEAETGKRTAGEELFFLRVLSIGDSGTRRGNKGTCD